ncbi:GTP-binding protein gtr2 [Sorochytrium milnesiophthora]
MSLHLPRVLLMGLRRSGKTSIQKVVFHKMAPNETLFLESTTKMGIEMVNSFMQFTVADFPGQIDFTDTTTFDVEAIFGETASEITSGCGAVVFVIDAQDEYYEALQRLYLTISTASKYNPNIFFEVFIHKVDGLSEEVKIETQRDIHQRVTDELLDLGLLDNIHLGFYQTSIYDHSIYEAFSKVVQKLIPQLPTLENILNALCSNSNVEKAFLFDTFTKIYIATDSSPVDMQSYELCSDMIDVMIDIESIYKQGTPPVTPLIDAAHPTAAENAATTGSNGSSAAKHEAEQDERETGSIIKLNNGIVLLLRQIDRYLALVCLLRSENFESKHGLIEFNFWTFKDALRKIFEVHHQFAVGGTVPAEPY